MVIKNQLQKCKDNGGSGGKWQKLESQFMQNFERLRETTSTVGTKFKTTEPHQQNHSLSTSGKDRLLDHDGMNNGNGYGTNGNGQQQQQQRRQENEQRQEQDQLFKPYDDLYEMENYEEQLYEILQNLQLLYESHKDLNLLIYDQDEVVEQLHDNVVDARDNVQSGVEHLDQAASHQKAYRGKLCILLGVLLVIAIIVTIVVVMNRTNNKN